MLATARLLSVQLMASSGPALHMCIILDFNVHQIKVPKKIAQTSSIAKPRMVAQLLYGIG